MEKNSKIPSFTLSLFISIIIHRLFRNTFLTEIYNWEIWHFIHLEILGTPRTIFSKLSSGYFLFQSLKTFYFWMCIETRMIDGAFLYRKKLDLFVLVNECSLDTNVFIFIFFGKKWWKQTLGTEYKQALK